MKKYEVVIQRVWAGSAVMITVGLLRDHVIEMQTALEPMLEILCQGNPNEHQMLLQRYCHHRKNELKVVKVFGNCEGSRLLI